MQPIAWRSLVRVQAIPLATVDRSSQVAPHNWPSTARVGEGLCLPECPRFTAHQRPLWTAQAPAGLPVAAPFQRDDSLRGWLIGDNGYPLLTLLLNSTNPAEQRHEPVSCALRDVPVALVKQAGEFIHFPVFHELQQNINQGFLGRNVFTGVLGAIDCTHVQLRAPTQNRHLSINRKGTYSVNVQEVCDANNYITDGYSNHPGSAHDSFILPNSQVAAPFQRDDSLRGWLIGDNGYPLLTLLLNSTNPAEQRGKSTGLREADAELEAPVVEVADAASARQCFKMACVLYRRRTGPLKGTVESLLA
ncbi:UNVERIFIED_CONTAM: hypothetical protein FKN15_075483 [Acipenser sinensis]